MLHKEAVSQGTLELIQSLQSVEMLRSFTLVGGTALSLQIGHRISIDIDLFTRDEFDELSLLEYLEHHYDFQEQYRHKNTLKGIIKGVFVDLIRHNYQDVEKPIIHNNLRIAGKQDIAAMKVNAISGDGTRIKDFIDLYFLLKDFTLSEIIDFYRIKYNTRNDFHAMKSLVFFDDIITDPWPNMIREKSLSIDKIKDEITRQMNVYLESRR